MNVWVKNSTTGQPSQTIFAPRVNELYDMIAQLERVPTFTILVPHMDSDEKLKQASEQGTDIEYSTLRDLIEHFWMGYVKDGTINVPRGLLLFYKRHPGHSEEISKFVLYYLLSIAQDRQLDLVKDVTHTQVVAEVGSVLKRLGKPDVAERWERYTTTDDPSQFMDEVRAQIRQIEQSIANVPATLQVNLEPILEDDLTQTITGSSVMFVIGQLSEVNSSLDYIFATLKTSVDTPLITYKGLYKLNVNQLLSVDYGFRLEDYKKPIRNSITRLFDVDTAIKEWKTRAQSMMIVMQFTNEKIACLQFNAQGLLCVYTHASNIDFIRPTFVDLISEAAFNQSADPRHTQQIDLEGSVHVPGLEVDPFLLSTFVLTNSAYRTTSHEGFLAFNEHEKSPDSPCYFWLRVPKSSSPSIEQANAECRISVLPYQGKLVTRLQLADVQNNVVYGIAVQVLRQMLFQYKTALPALTTEMKKVGYVPVNYNITNWSLNEVMPFLKQIAYERGCSHVPVPITSETYDTLELHQRGIFRYHNNDLHLSCAEYAHLDTPHDHYGLKRNTHGNIRDFPQLPCCYTKSAEHKTIGVKDQQQLKLTDSKAMDAEHRGTLPLLLQQFLFTIQPEHQVGFVRLGMSDSYWSFLECILYALYPEFRGLSSEDKQIHIQTELVGMANEPHALAAGAQQWGIGVSTEDIQEELQHFSDTTYLDPRKWLRMFEAIYNTNIYVFQYVHDQSVRVLFPRFEMFDASLQSHRPNSIFLYEHQNVDNKPKCELIGLTDPNVSALKSKLTVNLPDMGNAFAPRYWSMSKNWKYSIDTCSLSPIVYGFLYPYNDFQAQILDRYGKCRALQDKNKILYFCDPCPPFQIPILTTSNNMFSPALEYIPLPTCQIVSVSREDDTEIVKELHLLHPDLPNLLLTVKVDDASGSFDDMEQQVPMKYPNREVQTEQYERMSKMANVLESYFQYYFANYLRTNKIEMKWNQYSDYDDPDKVRDAFLLSFLEQHVNPPARIREAPPSKLKKAFKQKLDRTAAQAPRYKIPRTEDFKKGIAFILERLVVDLDQNMWPKPKEEMKTYLKLFMDNYFVGETDTKFFHDGIKHTGLKVKLNERENSHDAFYLLYFVLLDFIEYVRSQQQGKKWQMAYPVLESVDYHSDAIAKVRAFMDTEVIVDASVTYVMPTHPLLNMTQLESNGFVNRVTGKFVANSEALRKKLTYQLVYHLSLQDDILNYDRRSEIPNFYRYLQDWSNDPATLVVDNLVELSFSRQVVQSVDKNTLKAFVRHPDVVGGKLVYANLAETEEDAMAESNLWNGYGIPPDLAQTKIVQKPDQTTVYKYAPTSRIVIEKSTSTATKPRRPAAVLKLPVGEDKGEEKVNNFALRTLEDVQNCKAD